MGILLRYSSYLWPYCTVSNPSKMAKSLQPHGWMLPGSGHMWESQVLLRDGQVVFLRVLRFSPTFDERSARYKWNILERAVKPKSKKKKKKNTTQQQPSIGMNKQGSHRLEKYLKMKGSLEKSLKTKFVLKSPWKLTIDLEKYLNFTFSCVLDNFKSLWESKVKFLKKSASFE